MSKFVARRNFTYSGSEVVPGQVFDRLNQRWDERLIEKGFVTRFDGNEKSLIKCGTCNREFEGQQVYDAHMIKHTPGRVPGDEALDQSKIKVEPPKKIEETHPDGLTIKLGEPIPADVALA